MGKTKWKNGLQYITCAYCNKLIKGTELKPDAVCAARWWADRFYLQDRRQEFQDALAIVLSRVDNAKKSWRVYNDYDGDDSLWAALKLMKIKQPNRMFSADGFFPCKAGVYKNESGVLQAKAGEYQEWDELK